MRYLDGPDNGFVAAENGGTSMTVAGLIEIKGNIDQKVLETELERWSGENDRLRQRFVQDQGLFCRPYWLPMGDSFQIRNHLTICPLPSSPAALHDEIGRLLETPLSYEIPLWHVTAYHSRHDGPSATSYLLFRVSHIVSDGQGIARTLMSLVTDRAPSFPNTSHKAGRQFHRRHIKDWPWRLVTYVMMFAVMIYNLLNILFHSRRSLRAPKSAVHHQVGFSSAVKISEVKELRRLVGTSFNDILVSCVGTAIERHLIECNQLHDKRILFMIPTSLRADHDTSLSNQSSVFTLSVPIGVPEMKRLATISRRLHRQKATIEPEIVYEMCKLARWPRLISHGAFLAEYCNEVIVTNVPGPATSTLFIGDMQIATMTPIVCLAHQNTIGVGLLSYGDEVRMSVHMKLDEQGDKHAVYGARSANHIAELFVKSFEELRDRVRSDCGELNVSKAKGLQ